MRGKSTGKGKGKHPAKKGLAHAKRSKKVDESSDEEEWPHLVSGPLEVWAQCQDCKN